MLNSCLLYVSVVINKIRINEDALTESVLSLCIQYCLQLVFAAGLVPAIRMCYTEKTSKPVSSICIVSSTK